MTLDLASAPPPAPRSFRWGAIDSAGFFLLLFGAIWGVVGWGITVAFTVTGGPLWDDLLLDRRGVVARAIPTSIQQTGIRINRRQVHRISFQFTDADGVARMAAAGTSAGAIMASAQNHEPLDIEYDPRRPERARLRGEHASAIGYFVLLPFAFAAIGTLILIAGVRRIARMRQIYVHGQSVLATVTEISATNMRVNGQRVMRVHFIFDTVMGKIAGSTTSRRPPEAGSRLWVLYDEADPQRNVAA